MSCPNCGAPGGGPAGCGSCGLGQDPNVGGAFNAGQDQLQSNTGGGGGGCFSLRTRVLAAHGWVAIGSVKRGDAVASFDSSAQKIEFCDVKKVKRYAQRRIWLIHTMETSKPIETTWSHSFLTDRGWVWAYKLNSSDYLTRVDDNYSASRNGVRAIERSGAIEDVVNLSTSGPSTYIVEGSVVHNYSVLRNIRSLNFDQPTLEPDWNTA